jgi:hypothetical protein
VPVLLLGWFGIARGGLLRGGRRLLLLLGLLALAYMLGRYTPLYPFAYDLIPGVALFRRPVDANVLLTAVLALLSGHLLADLMREERGPRLLPALAASALAAALIGVGIWFSHQYGRGQDALLAALPAVAVFVLALLVLVLARSDRARARAAWGLTAIAVAELLYWNVGFRLNAEPRALYAVLERPAGADARTLAVLEAAIAARQAAGARPRVEFLGLGGPWQNIGVVRGIEAVNGYNPLRIGDYDRLVRPGESNWLVSLRDFPPSFPGYESPLARALGLEFLVLGRPITEVPNLRTAPVGDVLLAGPPHWIYRLAGTLPRVSMSEGSARITRWQPDRIEIAAQAPRGGILVLHDPYYPGWVASVNGDERPVGRAGLFRSVELPPGRHTVVLRYAPFSRANLAEAIAVVFARR